MSYQGIQPIYAYNNVASNIEDQRVSCGQAAIASLFDYYNVSPYSLQRTQMSQVDGKNHYPNTLVEHVMKDHPPASILNFRFTTREIILHALKSRGISTSESYAAAFGDGTTEWSNLKKWLLKQRRPVLVLIDLHDLSKKSNVMGNYPNWYALHWAFVYGFTNTHVQISSWERTFSVPIEAFMAGWHCKGLPYPNNFYAIYNYK